MSSVESIEIKLDGDQRVTQILAHGIVSEDISVLCDDLTRCCGHEVMCTEISDSDCTLVPQKPVIIDDIPKTYIFLTKYMGDFVGDIGFGNDKEAILTQKLLRDLMGELNEKKARLKLLNKGRKDKMILTGDFAEKSRQVQSLRCSSKIIDRLRDEIQCIGQLVHYISEHGFSSRCETLGCDNFISLKRVKTTHKLVCCNCIKEKGRTV